MMPFPMPARPLASTIPLHCNICAKKPNFSDVSHLLTHIASKGHLSTYYKLKVRAGSEDASRHLIESYDNWYAIWRIEDLMSERMNTKDQKRKPRTAKLLDLAGVPLTTQPYYSRPAQYAQFLDHVVDLNSAQHTIKAEPTSPTTALNVDPSLQHSVYGLPFSVWHQPLPYAFMLAGHSIKEEDGDVSNDTSTRFPAPASVTVGGNIHVQLSGQEQDMSEALETVHESNKLKGIMWPGMDLFDAATPEARRKRNQKKDISVVEHLEAMSHDIEATEMVFSSHGSFQKSRVITGFPHSDSSPLMGEELPLKKAKRPTRRQPLAEKSTNAIRRPRTKAKVFEQLPYYADGRPQFDDCASNGNSAPANKAKKKRKAKKAVEASKDSQATFEQPAELSYLTATFQPQSPRNDTIINENMFGSPGLFRPSDPAFYSTYQPHYTADSWPDQSSLEPAFSPAWDFLGQTICGTIGNPLFTESDQSLMIEDDQATISAPMSEN